ncbi:MAG: hypothetical protein QOJ51_6318, partial [Acidobacteriaceae bacterium]|nr:hypothetical protein [Acidobacteriaceae bacterium]
YKIGEVLRAPSLQVKYSKSHLSNRLVTARQVPTAVKGDSP